MKIKNLFNVGVDDTLDPDLRMRVASSNVVFVTIALILAGIIGLNANTYWTNGITSFRSLIPILLLSISIGCMLLNRFRWCFAARLIFFLSWTLFITAFPVWRPVTVYGYFLQPMLGIVSSTMVLLMFSFRKERTAYLVFLIFSMLITTFSFDFVSWFDRNGVSEIVMTHTTHFSVHLYPFCFTVFFNLVFIYVIRINEKYFDLQQQQHEIIVRQNKQLSETRLKLELTNSELEARVHERTQELLEQNTRLTDYAFFHAHVLRAPVSRIRGLLDLMNLTIDPAEEKQVRDMLSVTVNELDKTIHSMNDKFQTNNLSGR